MTVYGCTIASLSVACRFGAVLRDLLRARSRRKRRGSSGVFAIDFHLVSPTFGNGAGLRDGWSGFGLHDFTRRRSIHHQPIRMASSVRVSWRPCIVTRPAPQLALPPGTWGNWKQCRSGRTFWNDLAAGPAFFCLLDYHCHSFRKFDQHERRNHSPFRTADRSRPPARKCGNLRIRTRWIKFARQDCSGMAAGSIFRATCRARNQRHYCAGNFPSRSGGSFPAGCLAAALIGVGAGGEAAITPYLLTRYFGLRAFSTLYGLTWTFYAAAGAIGPVILGRAFDATGSYASLLTVLAAALGLAAATNLLLPRYSDSFAFETQ